jgi:hypothetical protein
VLAARVDLSQAPDMIRSLELQARFLERLATGCIEQVRIVRVPPATG